MTGWPLIQRLCQAADTSHWLVYNHCAISTVRFNNNSPSSNNRPAPHCGVTISNHPNNSSHRPTVTRTTHMSVSHSNNNSYSRTIQIVIQHNTISQQTDWAGTERTYTHRYLVHRDSDRPQQPWPHSPRHRNARSIIKYIIYIHPAYIHTHIGQTYTYTCTRI